MDALRVAGKLSSAHMMDVTKMRDLFPRHKRRLPTTYGTRSGMRVRFSVSDVEQECFSVIDHAQSVGS